MIRIINQINKISPKKSQEGVVVIIFAIALVPLLALAGMALDSGRAYAVKAQLSAAVDAAALAAAKAVGSGINEAEFVGNKYFEANYPADYFGTEATLENLSFATDTDGNITIDATANTNLDTTFLKVIGISDMDVGSSAQTIRRPVDLAFVVDNTTSLRLGSLGDVTDDVVDRSKDFVDNFHESVDRVALIKYAYGAETPVAFEPNRGFKKSDVKSEIDNFEFGGNGAPNQFTNSSEGFWHALDAHQSAINPSSLRAIVFFNDGAPNTFAATFQFQNAADQAGAIRSNDQRSGTPAGVWRADYIARPASSPWGDYGNGIDSQLDGFPTYYNPHNPSENEFLVINPSHPRRPVTDYKGGGKRELYEKVNRVSRNLVEDMAERARKDGIYVFTLGLGSRLQEPTGPDNERGEDLLIRMANDPAMANGPLAGDFKPDQLQGIYCHAIDRDALGPCFEEILDVIIRLSM